MKYVRTGNKIIASLDKGEELCATLRRLAVEENIGFATVSAHGTGRMVRLGSYSTSHGSTFEYSYSELDYELVSVTGELTGGAEPQLCLHALISNTIKKDEYLSNGDRAPGVVYGGILDSATISAACTVVLELFDLDARLVPVDAPSKGLGFWDRLGATFTLTDEMDKRYLKLEFDEERLNGGTHGL